MPKTRSISRSDRYRAREYRISFHPALCKAGGQQNVDRRSGRGPTQTHGKKRLFVALSRAVAPAELMLPHVTEHLRYMDRLEAADSLFASGPFVQEGVLVEDGLTILQTERI
jgi:hypothetical protein